MLHVMSLDNYIMPSYQFYRCIRLTLCHLLIGTVHMCCNMNSSTGVEALSLSVCADL